MNYSSMTNTTGKTKAMKHAERPLGAPGGWDIDAETGEPVRLWVETFTAQGRPGIVLEYAQSERLVDADNELISVFNEPELLIFTDSPANAIAHCDIPALIELLHLANDVILSHRVEHRPMPDSDVASEAR